MNYRQSTIPTTRIDFNARLLSLSIQNEELEARHRETEQICDRYEIKVKAQHALVVNLTDAIHAMANTTSCANTDTNGGSIPEEMCSLFTRNARRISELSQEVEIMKLLLAQQVQGGNVVMNKSTDQINKSADELNKSMDQMEPSATYNDDDDDENASTTSSVSSSSSSSSSSIKSDENIALLEDELDSVKSQCQSLERSFQTLKRKNMGREVRSLKSLRNMRRQVSELEQERKRRLDLQATAETRVVQLENELDELREKIFRRERPVIPDIIAEQNQKDSDTEERFLDDVNSSTLKGVDHCREMVMLRNKVLRQSEDYYPPSLVTVSEDSEGSDESDESEDECGPCMNAYLAVE